MKEKMKREGDAKAHSEDSDGEVSRVAGKNEGQRRKISRNLRSARLKTTSPDFKKDLGKKVMRLGLEEKNLPRGAQKGEVANAVMGKSSGRAFGERGGSQERF